MKALKLTSFINCLFIVLAALIAVFMLGSAVFFNVHSAYSFLLIMAVLIFTIIIVYAALKLNRYSSKAYILVLVFMSFTMYFLWNIYASTEPVSDYKVIFQGAERIINGSFREKSFNKSSYFYFYNYQIVYTSYIALIMEIFGNKLLWFKLFDWFYMTLTSIIMYKLINKISTKDAAAVGSIFYALYIPNIIGSSVVNNQHISTLFLCLALYFIIRAERLYDVALSGVMLGFTQILRPVGVIIIIAVTIVYAYKSFTEKRYRSYFKYFALFILCYMLTVKGFDAVFMKAGLAPGPISQSNAKYFKFVLGLKGEGLYNIQTENAEKTQVYFDLKTLNFDYEKYNKECIEAVKTSLKDYKNTLIFVKDKMINFTGGMDNQLDFSLAKDKLNNNVYLLGDAGSMQYILLLICTTASLILKLKKYRQSIDIFYILLIGFVLVHVFIEAQTRYRYEVYVFLIILSAEIGSFIKKKVIT